MILIKLNQSRLLLLDNSPGMDQLLEQRTVFLSQSRAGRGVLTGILEPCTTGLDLRQPDKTK